MTGLVLIALIVWTVAFVSVALYGLWHFSAWATEDRGLFALRVWRGGRHWWPRRRMTWWAYRQLRRVCPHPAWRHGIYRSRKGCPMVVCMDCNTTWHQTYETHCARCSPSAASESTVKPGAQSD